MQPMPKFSPLHCITLNMFLTNSYLHSDPTPLTNWDQEYTTIFSHPRMTLNLSKDHYIKMFTDLFLLFYEVALFTRVSTSAFLLEIKTNILGYYYHLFLALAIWLVFLEGLCCHWQQGPDLRTQRHLAILAVTRSQRSAYLSLPGFRFAGTFCPRQSSKQL